jgi:hypothetical protein
MIEVGTLHVQTRAMPVRVTGPRIRVEDFERIEDYLGAYLGDERFKSRYPHAQERWSQTWATLWQADSREKLIAVAAEAREVMWEFACALGERNAAAEGSPDATEMVERLSELVEMRRPELGDSRCRLLQALFGYWQALNEVVQSHRALGAQRVRERLTWEDGRRLVVLTALVMVEVDRSL